MAETLLFELVSPQRLLISEEVEMVVVPGAAGYFGALPRHSPLITSVVPGVIDVYRDGAVTDRIFVTGGFAEATETGCTVLAEEAFPLAELTAELVQDRVSAAEKAVDEAEDETSRARAGQMLKTALAMREAQGGVTAH